MDLETISYLKSIAFIAMFVIASRLCVPKSFHFWELWKKTKKPAHLGNAVASIMAAFFFYAADFMVMMQGVMGWK